MTAKECRTLFARLMIVILVLLVGGVSVWAQEQQKEPPKKVEERGGKRGEAKPAKAPEKKAAPQQTANPRQEKPAQPQNRPKQETAPPTGNRPAQQAPPTVTPRGQQPAQRPPDTGQRTTQPQVGRPVQQPPRQTPPPTAVPRTEQQRPPQGGRPAASETQREPQGGRPAASEMQQRPQGEGRRGPTGIWSARPVPPGRVVTTRGGDTVHRDQGGRVTEVRVGNGAVVYHAPTGVRHVEVMHPGGRVIVAEAPGHGYVQRPLVVHDRSFVKRTYFYGGVSYARVYRPVTYRGAMFEIYTPVRYYRPGFYAYVFNPWMTPVAWTWGWGGSPWYGYYGGYFSPYAYYRSPALWLTDYFIAATLEAAYQERMAAGVAPVPVGDGEVALSPEVKQLVADEVQRQIEYERAESQSAGAGYPSDDTPEWADNRSHVFVAYTALDVNSSGGYCTIGEGDVLQLNSMPPAYSPTADLVVLASRHRHCRQGSVVSVQLQDLQDMSNRMRETVEAGLADLQTRQGQRGIPPLPPAAVGTIDTPLAGEAAPDVNAGAELNQAYRDTDQAEQAALAQAGNDAGTPTVSLGQTIDQVRAVLGPPQQIMNAGAKQIYIYQNVKVTFVNGRVSDIQ
jgi:hypothetical protein